MIKHSTLQFLLIKLTKIKKKYKVEEGMIKQEVLEGMQIGTNCLECILTICVKSFKKIYICFDSVILLLEIFHKETIRVITIGKQSKFSKRGSDLLNKLLNRY